MSRLSETARVGAIVIIAVLILAGVGYYVFGPGRAGNAWPLEIIFEDARGLTGGEAVRMAGVQIGIVDQVSLAGKGMASVKVLIREEVPLYENYLFSISSGALVPERYVKVEPVEPIDEDKRLGPDSQVVGLESPGLPEIISAAYTVLSRLEETAASINSLIGDQETQRAIKHAVLEFEETAHRASLTMAQLQMFASEARPEIAEATRQISLATQEAHDAVSYITQRIKTSSAPDQLEEAIASINMAAKNVGEAAASVNSILSEGNVKSDIQMTLSNTREMSENLRQASEDVKSVTGDIKDSSPKIKSIIASAESVLADADQLKDRLRPPTVEPSFDFLTSSREDRTFTDVRFDLSFAGQRERFVRLGVSDVGEENDVNLQAGRRLGNKQLRYGLVRSKLGVGADLAVMDGGQLSLDIFDPNRLRADLLLEYPLASPERGWGMILGVRDAFGEDLGFIGARVGK